MPSPSPFIKNLHAYTPGLQPQDSGWVKLNTNENPYPPSPRVKEAILNELGSDANKLRLYPEPSCIKLREAVAQQNALSANQVFIGNGSDEILKYLVMAYTDATRKAVMLKPSYSLYPVLTDILEAEITQVPFTDTYELPVDALLAEQANLIFITQPNAPLGIVFEQAAIARLAESTDALIVIDEAYVAFAKETALPLLKKYNNICITRTFSKSHGLAGMRIGYCMADAEVIDVLDRVRDAYNVDRLTQVAALAALEDVEYYDGINKKSIETREAFTAFLKELGWEVFPSEANFVFTKPCKADGESGSAVASELYNFLTEKKILIRYFPKDTFTADYLRISIGLDAEMQILKTTIEQWLKNA